GAALEVGVVPLGVGLGVHTEVGVVQVLVVSRGGPGDVGVAAPAQMVGVVVELQLRTRILVISQGQHQADGVGAQQVGGGHVVAVAAGPVGDVTGRADVDGQGSRGQPHHGARCPH